MTAAKRLLSFVMLLLLGSPAVVHAQQARFSALLGLAPGIKSDAGDQPAARRCFEEARTLHPFTPAELTGTLLGRGGGRAECRAQRRPRRLTRIARQ